MKSIILAAGEGKRWRESGGQGPKQLAKLQRSTSILANVILNQYCSHSNDHVYVVLGYEKEIIEISITQEISELCGSSNFLHFIYNDKWNESGTAYSLLCARNIINRGEPFFVSSGDQIVPQEVYRRLYDVYRREPCDEMLAAGSTVCFAESPQNVFVRYPSIPNNLLSVKNQFYIYHTKRVNPKEESSDQVAFLYDMGVYLLQDQIFDLIEESISNNESDLITTLVSTQRLKAVSMFPDDYWYNINTLRELHNYEET